MDAATQARNHLSPKRLVGLWLLQSQLPYYTNCFTMVLAPLLHFRIAILRLFWSQARVKALLALGPWVGN